MKLIPLSGRRGAAALCILLSACAAGPLNALGGGPDKPGPAYGAFLAARYADDTGDPAQAAKFYRIALHAAPDNQELISAGFLAGVLSGDAGAAALAARQPHNALAIMLLANQAAMGGDFATAQAGFATLPQDNLTGLIQPLLIAWTLYGQGNEQAALNGLGPYFNSGDFGAVYVLNAALIADAAGDSKNAAQLYGAVDGSQPNLRMAQILASWATRQGQNGQAMAELSALVAAHPDLAIALPAGDQQRHGWHGRGVFNPGRLAHPAAGGAAAHRVFALCLDPAAGSDRGPAAAGRYPDRRRQPLCSADPNTDAECAGHAGPGAEIRSALRPGGDPAGQSAGRAEPHG
jgi:hypothetical protein